MVSETGLNFPMRFRPEEEEREEEEEEEVEVDVDAAVVAVIETHRLRRWLLPLMLPPTPAAKRLPIATTARMSS